MESQRDLACEFEQHQKESNGDETAKKTIKSNFEETENAEDRAKRMPTKAWSV